MSASLRRGSSELLLSVWRCLAVVAIAAKLLIPTGYMPAALADGGIALCDALPWPQSMPADHAHAMPTPAGHGHEHVPAHDDSDMPAGPDPSGGEHHASQYCPLGALASAAAMAADRQVYHADATSREITAPPLARPAFESTTAFHARAPPLSLLA